MSTSRSPLLFSKPVGPRRIFAVKRLPLVAHLMAIAFRGYRRRWTKRLFKNLVRLVFDVAYHGLRLGGTGVVTLELADGRRDLAFNARNHQFSGLYAIGDRLYEPEVLSLLDIFLTGERVFFDIGANWGYLALYAATVPECRGAIHAFEPLPSSFADLESMVAQAGLTGRIACHPMALSDRAGAGHMVIPDGVSSGQAKLTTDEKGADVPLARLDDLDLPDPAFMKIDVEDHELNVLKGGEALLRRAKPHLVFENWLNLKTPGLTAAPLRYAEGLGYRLFQPCWMYPAEGGYFVWPDDQPPDHVAERILALVPMSVEQRFLMQERINVFACHEERVDELRRHFAAEGPGRRSR